MAERITLIVDGVSHTIEADPDMPLLYALRDDVGLDNPRFGCGLAQCGACTVHVDGVATRSCVTPLSAVAGRNVTTLAGLGTPDDPHPLQTAFIAEQSSQCGYCLNGWIMTAAAVMAETPHPPEALLRERLAGVKCRCGAYPAIYRAILRAARA